MAGGLETGGTVGTGRGTGTKSNLTERLDLGRVGGIDNGWTGVRCSGEGRGSDDDGDNKDWVSSVEIKEMESIFTLSPAENPLHYCWNHHHCYHHHHWYYHHQNL